MAAVYRCLEDALHAGYLTGPKRWVPAEHVENYRFWARGSTAPFRSAAHGDRFLLPWVNAAGAAAYLSYGTVSEIPEASVLAAETFRIGPDGTVEAGPLYLMQKAAAGTSPETDDWFYMLVAPQGRPVAINVISACHDCHARFGAQGSLGYPPAARRVPSP
ncbi:MAG: hypothetical protein AAGE18_15890 [Pseudomonadota bacterium]